MGSGILVGAMLVPLPLVAVWPKWDAPDGVVALVDTAVVVAVGGKSRAGLADGFSPDDVVGGVDDSVVVVVAEDAGDGEVDGCVACR